MLSVIRALTGLIILRLITVGSYNSNVAVPLRYLHRNVKLKQEWTRTIKDVRDKPHNFNASNLNVLIVHGMQSSNRDEILISASLVFLPKYSCNLFYAEWHVLDEVYNLTALEQYEALGQHLALSVNEILRGIGVNISQLHTVGFGEDVYVISSMTKHLKDMQLPKVARVVALNPSRTDWNELRATGLDIKSMHAEYIEIYHTEILKFGISKPQGTVDIYFNGGKTQPGCADNECSHNRAWIYYFGIIHDPRRVSVKWCLPLFLDEPKCESNHGCFSNVISNLERGIYCAYTNSSFNSVM